MNSFSLALESLVGGLSPTFLKKMDWGENKKIIELPPPRIMWLKFKWLDFHGVRYLLFFMFSCEKRLTLELFSVSKFHELSMSLHYR